MLPISENISQLDLKVSKMGFTNSKVQYRETPGIRKRFQYDYKTKTSTDYFIVVMSEPSGNLFKK